jgi:hypothetical protein
VILSITVLQHVVDDAVAEQELGLLRAKAVAGSRLLLWEYACDAPGEAAGSDYQARRTVQSWTRMLAKNGWSVTRVEPMSYPMKAPSMGFLQYYGTPVVLACRSLKRLKVPSALWLGIANRAARKVLEKTAISLPPSSPVKLLDCLAR